jgi:hypothetical protein
LRGRRRSPGIGRRCPARGAILGVGRTTAPPRIVPRRPPQRRGECGGRLDRSGPSPEPPHVHIDVVQLGKTSGSPRCSEPATLRAARVVLAYRKARTRLPARSSTRGAGRRVRSAVGECLIGRPEDQRGARTACGQGEQVAQGAAVAQLVTVPASGEEVADLDAACPLAPRVRASAPARLPGT